MIKALLDKGHEVKVVMTEHSKEFISRQDIYNKAEDDVEIFTDDCEWVGHYKKGDLILHVDLAEWADTLVVAPLSANTMAKMANGICDNLLTCVVRAWSDDKPLVLAPAMNTEMWHNRITNIQCREICDNYDTLIVSPTNKMLACGTEGMGAMADIDDIIHATENFYNYGQSYIHMRS
jgi:phosphopantothenoylcysteine synthetase/decarboxylase